MGKKALARMTPEQFEALPPYKQKQVALRLVAGMRAPSPSSPYNRKLRRSDEFKAALASKKAADAIEAAKKVEALSRSEDLGDTEQEAGEKESAPE